LRAPYTPVRLAARDHVAEVRTSLPLLDLQGFTSHRWEKYADQERWLPFNLSICRTVGLIDAPRQRLLDVGCGSGLLLFCARHFGHDAIGIDVDDALLARIAEIYGVDRRVQPVRDFVPLDVEGQFDVVTCVATHFDREIKEGVTIRYWGRAEWAFFLADIEARLTDAARVFLIINRESYRPDAREYYDDRVREALWHGSLGNRRFLFDRTALRRAIDNLAR
jgi:SAM-dependent methyltransferase